MTSGPRQSGLPDPHKAAKRRRLRRKRQAHGATSGSSGKVKSEINVTPFVDVVLVLLIIFMVVTPMLQRGVEVLLPRSENHSEQRDNGDQIIISVKSDGTIYLGQNIVSEHQLEAQLRPLLRSNPPPPVFVKGDRRLTFKPMRRIMEICHRAGAPGIALATEKRADR